MKAKKGFILFICFTLLFCLGLVPAGTGAGRLCAEAAGTTASSNPGESSSSTSKAPDAEKPSGGWSVVSNSVQRSGVSHGAAGAKDKFSDWTEIAEVMNTVLDEALQKYDPSDESSLPAAFDLVDKAYFRYYEKQGFEKNVLNFMSNGRVNVMEALFRDSKRVISSKGDKAELEKLITTLKKSLLEDAAKLDGMKGESAGRSSAAESFMISFALMMREGLEAILVIAALLAYLVKTDNRKYLKHIYWGAFLGIVSSVLLAVGFRLLSRFFGEVGSGRGQEIFEGVTMLLAVVVLFWVSNWMINKSEVEEWNRYIKRQVETTVTTGSVCALVFSAWLAVAREGAEVVLFFQGILNNETTDHLFLWLGIAASLAVLAVIFVLFRVFSVKLPLKPFFYFTSIVMFLLCFSFVGKGIHEFQEANLIPVHHLIGKKDELSGVVIDAFSVDLLGIFDRIENLIPQLLLLLLTLWTFVLHGKKKKAFREAHSVRSE